MGRIKKTFYVVAPLLAFSYLAYEYATTDVPDVITRKARPAHDALVWISAVIGPTPLAAILFLLGFLLSLYAYRNY